MLFSILIGAFLTAITICIHSLGTTFWVGQLHPQEVSSALAKPGPFRGMRILCTTALVLFLLHTIEILVWAVAFLLIPDMDQITTVEEAVYFSMVTFGSLGYGDIVIDSRWRLLSGIECMAGLLVFGLSTALLLSVIQQIWKAEWETK